MRRWGVAFLIAFLACIPIYAHRSASPELLQDTDTAVLLKAVRERHQPFSWFVGDWPLENHFYRPMPTLAFEVDNALYGNDAAGYGRTNALLAVACVLLLFWFFRELTANPVLTAASTCLFALWSSNLFYDTLSDLLYYLALGAALYYVILLLARMPLSKKSQADAKLVEESSPLSMERKRAGKEKLKTAAVAVFMLLYASLEMNAHGYTAINLLESRVVTWLPGRTASVMLVFCLIAMAAYARYERVSAKRVPKAASPLDPPATKSTEIYKPPRFPWVWGLVACMATALALASYEQAVMLPAALLGVAVSLRMQRYKVRWGWQIPFWLLLIGYLLLRKEILPPGISHYQRQQYRNSVSVYLAILDYCIPTLSAFWNIFVSMDFMLLLQTQVWVETIMLVSNVVAYIRMRKRFVIAITGLVLSVITYLPMAWLKQFEHYAYWPMAMRSLFVVTITWLALEALFSAVSRPVLQAPPRPDPAPGSLPHR